MKLKNIEIMNSIPVINKLLQSDIDITAQFVLNKNTTEINNISKAYVDGRNKLLDKYDSCGKYIYDLAVQRMIIEGDLKKTHFTNKKINYYLAVLNHEYVFDGKYENNKPVYTDDIIRIFDFTKITEEYQNKISFDKEEIKHFLHEDADCGKKNCEEPCVCANERHGQN